MDGAPGSATCTYQACRFVLDFHCAVASAVKLRCFCVRVCAFVSACLFVCFSGTNADLQVVLVPQDLYP